MEFKGNQFDLFATRVWVFELTALRERFPFWRSKVHELRKTAPAPAGRSIRLGWNSENTLFEDSDFDVLNGACKDVFRHVFNQMQVVQDLNYKLNAWANINDRGSYNKDHIHQNVLLSGIFYLSVPKGSGLLVLNDPRSGAILSPFQGKGVNSGHFVEITPVEGNLIIFPNWLSHGVEPHQGVEPRVSIAMNAVAAPR